METPMETLHRMAGERCPILGGRQPEARAAEWALQEIERLRTGHQRYETARRMNPRQWADAWKLNTTTGKPFDEIIDDMRPFMVPNKQ